MNVLVINCGSSSLKYQLIDSETENVLAKGLCERIGIDGRLVYQKAGCDKEITEAAMPTHKEAIQMVLDALTNDKTGAIGSLKEVNAIGHRVVHGGEKFASSAVITDEMIKAVEECNDLAPLHNPANLIGIRVCAELMPGVPQVGVFDTAFHQTMPAKAYLYGLPLDFYKKYKVRRYGFHGTSHSFVSKLSLIHIQMCIRDREKGVTFDVSYDNCNADASVMEQIISDFQADKVDLMVGVATPDVYKRQEHTGPHGAGKADP